MRNRFLLLLVATSSAVSAQTPRGVDRTLAGLSRSFESTVEKVSPAVVQVIANVLAADDRSAPALMRGQRSGGSGVIVDAEGYIVTNAHVVGFARRVQVLLPVPAENRANARSVIKPSGRLVPARVVGMDRETDIAVLKVDEKGLHPLRFGDSEALRQGQLVFAFGSPFGLDNTVTMGIVSSPARQLRPDHPMIYVQTDAPINPGNSGGPLVDTDSQIVGLNTFIVSLSGTSGGVGFAVPSNIVMRVYEQIKKEGRVRRGQIGIQAQTITPELARALRLEQDCCVIVGDVAPGGAAEAAGIQVRDVLLTLNGKPLENARQFGVNVYQRANETVTLEILRGREKITRQVAVLERPRDTEQILSMVSEEANLIPRLGVLALNLDARTTPLLPPLRKLSGVVVAGMIAEAAGSSEALYPADVIYAVNDRNVSNAVELTSALNELKPGDHAALQIERGGQLQFVVVEVQ